MLARHPQMDPSYYDIQLDLPGNNQTGSTTNSHAPHNITVEYAERQMSHRERNFLQMLSTFTSTPDLVDKIAVATCLDAAALLTIQAIYHDPKRVDWTTCEYIAYHILVTWYASTSNTQTEKLCKLRDVYYAIGYAKDFDMLVADSKFELPRMGKGGNRKQTPAMGVSALSRQNSFSPNSQVSSGPNGENTVGKRILDATGDQTTQNSVNSGEEQLIAFGEATLENVGMGTDKNTRTVTFELSQAQGDIGSSTTSPPPLISNDCLPRYLGKQSFDISGGGEVVDEPISPCACDNSNVTVLVFLSVPMPTFSSVASPNAMSCSSPEFTLFCVVWSPVASKILFPTVFSPLGPDET